MAFLALVLALLIEHVRPLAHGNNVHGVFKGFASVVRGKFDGGERVHGLLGWLIVMGCSIFAVLLAQWVAESLHPLFVFALHVFVLYCTIGFRQFSQAFAEIRIALAAGDPDGARSELDQWIDGDDFDDALASGAPDGDAWASDTVQSRQSSFAAAGRSRGRSSALESETCRRAVAHALVAAHRHVLGPMFAYVLIPGVLGPVIYRLAAMLARTWSRGQASNWGWGDFAVLAFAVIDWLPARLSAAGFAVVGNFEDAVYCWRGTSADRAGRKDSRALLLAAGGGSLGVKVADPALEARWAAGETGFECPGSEASPASLAATAGLVWRSLVLWLALFALITVSAWMGR